MNKVSFFKRLKKYISKIKWSKTYIFLYVRNEYFRKFLHEEKLAPSNAKKLEQIFRVLLSLNPRWERGHYLISRISFVSFENSKNGYFKGIIRLSKKALEALGSNNKLIVMVGELYNFTNQNYDLVIESLEKLVKTDDTLNKKELNLCCELLGSSYLIKGPESAAINWFEKIDKSSQTQELQEVISLLRNNLKN